jgi:hypothetical protein
MNTVARRPPYTDDYVCIVHKRKGSDEEENFCAATLFVRADDPQLEAAPTKPPEKPREYRPRPQPETVKALPSGSLMMVSHDNGPTFSMTRDEFFARYEEVEPEAKPEHETHALATMETVGDAGVDEVDLQPAEAPTPVEPHGRHHGGHGKKGGR